jgi:hypothetical protein
LKSHSASSPARVVKKVFRPGAEISAVAQHEFTPSRTRILTCTPSSGIRSSSAFTSDRRASPEVPAKNAAVCPGRFVSERKRRQEYQGRVHRISMCVHGAVVLNIFPAKGKQLGILGRGGASCRHWEEEAPSWPRITRAGVAVNDRLDVEQGELFGLNWTERRLLRHVDSSKPLA